MREIRVKKNTETLAVSEAQNASGAHNDERPQTGGALKKVATMWTMWTWMMIESVVGMRAPVDEVV